MNYDYSKLRGRIIEMYGSCEAFNEAANWHTNKVNRILNNRVKMFVKDLEVFCDLLNIEPCDIKDYFFVHKV